MITKISLISLVLLFSSFNAHAQLMDKLKQRAKEKGLETREVSYDTTDNVTIRNTSYEKEELVINSAKDFFTSDVVMKLYYDTNEVINTFYFDADTVAMRTELLNTSIKPMFNDSKGFFYAYNEKLGSYEKSNIMSLSGSGFMFASMLPKFYKLPSEPYLEAYGKLEQKGLKLNFLILELAFIYTPSDFENDSYYIPSKTKCNNSNNCIKFSYNDPEYPGSYIQFDEQRRLNEMYINTINPEIKKEEHPTSKYVYTYQDVSVKLPDAIEQSMVPGPLGKMLNLERGLEPWKHNKKDKN